MFLLVHMDTPLFTHVFTRRCHVTCVETPVFSR